MLIQKSSVRFIGYWYVCKWHSFKQLLFCCILFFTLQNTCLADKTDSTQTNYSDSTSVKLLNAKAREIISTEPNKAFFLTAKAYKIALKLSYPNGLALSLNGMGNAMYFLGNYDKALNYYEQSLLLYKTINDCKMEATVYANIGNIYHLQGNYNKALDYYKTSLKISINNQLLERTATTLGSLGILYYDKSEYASALNVYLKALQIREALNDKQGVAYTLSNIGLIYDDQAQYYKALGYFKKSLVLLNNINDLNGLSATLNNIGLVYYNLNQLDTALNYFNQSLEIAHIISNKSLIRSCYNNMGDIYKSKGNFKLATHFYELTEKLNLELNDIKSTAITLNSIADLYKQQGDYVKALSGFKESLRLSEQTGDKFMVKENYKNLAAVYALLNNYEEAYLNFQKFYTLYDDIFRESQRQLSEIQYKYESERIQSEVKILKKEKEVQLLLLERNNIIIYAAITGFVMLFLLFLFIYRANKQKTKANKKLKIQNTIIEKQKEEIKNEKLRADNQILSIIKGKEVDADNAFATIDDYEMVAALFKKMEEENIHSRFEILKSEVNPHFLFNSLNNLIGLIEENQAVAANYVQELSTVYLYVLKSKEKELVELADEVAFAKSYSFLLYRRFGNNIIFNMTIDDVFLKNYVPPLCMELLIENAVKHNIVTSSKPLTIDVYVENHYLIVKNNLQQKAIPETSTKIGLQNIEKRYSYLTDKKVEIIKTKREFIVKLPLIVLE